MVFEEKAVILQSDFERVRCLTEDTSGHSIATYARNRIINFLKMTIMITYQKSVSCGQPEVLTKEKWNELIDSKKVKNICKQIAALDVTDPEYQEKKQALKRKLPVIMPHAASFAHGKRVSADAVPSGLAMLDVDHVEEPRTWFERLNREMLIENHIFLVAITASGKGLRIIGARARGETIEAAQMRMAEALGITEYDAVTKDLARASYVVPRDYILWMDEEALLAEQDVEFAAQESSSLETLVGTTVSQELSPACGQAARPASRQRRGRESCAIRRYHMRILWRS